jgi:hypothetical protein
MGGSDNLMAGLAGVADAGRSVFDKLIDYELRRRSKEKDYLDEFNQFQKKLPLETQSRIEIEQARPRTTYIQQGDGTFVPVEGRVSRTPTIRPPALYQPMNSQTGELIGEPTANRPVPIRPASEPKEPGIESLIRGRDVELRKLRSDANPQKTTIPSINKLLNLIEKEGVTGKGGQVKAFIAPYAEAIGASSDELENAQTFQLLSRLLAGPMRLDIVGSGPVSNYEQQLLKELSGGGGTAKGAAKELLTYYKGIAHRKVSDYNSAAEDSISLSPRFKDIYKPIKVDEGNQDEISLPVTDGNDLNSQIQGQLPRGAKIKSIKRIK